MEQVEACRNIGPRERALRMRSGWFGAVLTVVTAAVLLAMRVPLAWRATVALPAAMSAFGFFQARANTCVAFAAANIKVLGDSRKDRIQVTDKAERAAFRRAAMGIYARGMLATAVVTAVVLAIP